jgi:hypothetical protein
MTKTGSKPDATAAPSSKRYVSPEGRKLGDERSTSASLGKRSTTLAELTFDRWRPNAVPIGAGSFAAGRSHVRRWGGAVPVAGWACDWPKLVLLTGVVAGPMSECGGPLEQEHLYKYRSGWRQLTSGKPRAPHAQPSHTVDEGGRCTL